MPADQSAVGCLGELIVATRRIEGPGEVLVRMRGGTEAYLAWFRAAAAPGDDGTCVGLAWSTFFRQARFLTLSMGEAEVAEHCVTKQGISLQVRAVIAFKVGNDAESIVNAGQRFLSDKDQISVLDGSKAEMAKMGLVVDSLQIQSIDDLGASYIDAMAAPHTAAIQRQAKIAQVQANQAAAEAEQDSQRRQGRVRAPDRDRPGPVQVPRWTRRRPRRRRPAPGPRPTRSAT
jgi:uncharacterized membrane protein YqiK